jgi:hypothetical protein
MWINVTDAMSCQNIRQDHIFHERRFAHAGLSDDVHVTTSVVCFDAKTPPSVTEIRLGEQGYLVFVIVRVFNRHGSGIRN